MKTKTRFLAFLVAAMAAMTMAGLTACGSTGGETGGTDDGGSTGGETTHTHSYSGYTATDEGHYQVCDGCGEATSVSEHEYDDVYDSDCNVCGYSRGTASARLEAYLTEYAASAEPDPDELNAYTATYEEMESYFVEQGVLTSEQVTNRVDILTTKGYLNILDGYGYDDYDGAYAFADAAYDYDGLWLIWFGGDSDVAAEVWSESTSWGAIDSGSLIVGGGGAVTMSIETYNGYFVLGFAKDYDETAKTAAETALESVSDDRGFDYYDVNDLISVLRSAGWISALDVVNATDLNSQYTYTYTSTSRVYDENGDFVLGEDGNYVTTTTENTKYVKLADEAYTYGNVTIYYFNTYDSWFSYYNTYYIYTNLVAGLTSDVYYSSNSTNYYYGYIYKYNSDNEYDENGTALSYSVDFIIGNFAISISD